MTEGGAIISSYIIMLCAKWNEGGTKEGIIWGFVFWVEGEEEIGKRIEDSISGVVNGL